jgi:hypothetical protein
MFRAASQPDKSNSPIATVCLIRLLIVIPAYPKDPVLEAVRPVYGLNTAQMAPAAPTAARKVRLHLRRPFDNTSQLPVTAYPQRTAAPRMLRLRLWFASAA